jgi:peptide/nickel transport system substrate-binding protein
LDRIVFRFISEDAIRVATLQTGETNIIENVPAHELPLLESDDSIQVFTVPIPGAPWHINLNTTRAPLDDLLVRQALIHAVSPQAIVDTLFGGIHSPANAPLNSVTFGYTEAVESLYEYDPERARELLEEAGWAVEGDDGIRQKGGEPLNLTLYVIAAGGYDDTAQMVQGQLREVGINAEIVLEERATMFADVNAGEHHMALRFWYGSDPDILNLHFNSADEGGWNWSKYSNSEIDRLLEQGASTLDEAERSRIYGEIQEILMEDAVMIPLFEHKYIVAAKTNVQGVKFDVRTYPWLYDAYIDQD